MFTMSQYCSYMHHLSLLGTPCLQRTTVVMIISCYVYDGGGGMSSVVRTIMLLNNLFREGDVKRAEPNQSLILFLSACAARSSSLAAVLLPPSVPNLDLELVDAYAVDSSSSNKTSSSVSPMIAAPCERDLA